MDSKLKEQDVKQFIEEELIKIYTSVTFTEIVSCHIHPHIIEDRLLILLDKVEKIITS